MSDNLTPLFPPYIVPVRDGVYLHKLSYSSKKFFSLWKNGIWHSNSRDKEFAAQQKSKSEDAYMSSFIGWRGLTKGD